MTDKQQPEAIRLAENLAWWVNNTDIPNAECAALSAACLRSQHAALAKKDAAIKELREALQGVIRVADRATVEFDAARAVLANTEDA